jgi:DNA/RNA endonuclease G (NUC1)
MVAAAASDRLPFGSDPQSARPPEETAALRIACRVETRARTVKCESPRSEDGDARTTLLGGQGVYVQLASSNIVVAHTPDPVMADTFAFDVTLQNLLMEAMATRDGVIPDTTGIRVFFAADPMVTGGTGSVWVANPDGVGSFTAAAQSYFRYENWLFGADSVLTGRIGGGAGEISGAKIWELAFGDNVTSFTFVVYVDVQTQPLVAINEVMANPSTTADSSREYVELINRGTLSVDLNGWILQDGTGSSATPNTPVTINQSLLIPGGKTALLARSADTTQNGNIRPDYVYAVPGAGGVMQFSNTAGDFVRLRTPNSVTIDSAKYTTLAISAVEGQSRERIGFGAGSANMDDNAFWRGATSYYSNADRGTPTPLSGMVPGVPEGVSLTPSDPPVLPVGYDKPVFITVRDSLGNDITASSTITWESLTPGTASVDSLGYVTGLAAGSAMIRASTATGGSGTITYTVVDATAGTTANYRDHLSFGAPTGGTADTVRVARAQFVSSYNVNRRQPNWVSWNLNATQFGAADRCNCFTDEPLVPLAARSYDWDYRGSGYDRGHMVQSESRTSTYQENATTFLLSNIIPQASANNQGPWLKLELYLDSLVQHAGKEVYVVAGGQFAATPPTLKGEGRVAIPDYTWKAALILDAGEGLADVLTSGDVEVIAVRIPNLTGANATSGDPAFAGTGTGGGTIYGNPWQLYITTVDSIEATTGYDLFAALGDAIENNVEARQGSGSQSVATSLAIITQPSATASAGTAFAQQPVIEVRDQFGNPYPGSGRPITVALATGTGTLNGTKTVNTASNGRATFTNLSIAEAGSFSLGFTAAGLAGATSDTIVVSGAPEFAPSVSTTSPVNGATGVSTSTNIVINFSEPVTPTGPEAFTLSCSTFTMGGSGTSTITLTPTSTLANSTTCSVTVEADSIHDVDANDPPDRMAADYSFSFTTAASGGGGPGQVIINEFMANAASTVETTGEFVELVNVGGDTVDISGWVVTDSAFSATTRHTFAAGTKLAPGRAIVVFGGAAGIPAGLTNAVAASSGGLGLNNTTGTAYDQVILKNSSGTIIEKFTYGVSLAADNVSANRNPDATAAGTFQQHSAIPGALGTSSPGKRYDGSAF